MWKVIRGVWIQMLCFSASRCRGYLHAKSLGSGRGLEMFAERHQRIQLRLPKEERVRIAKERIQQAAIGDASNKKSTGDPSTSQGKEEEKNAATPIPISLQSQ